MKDGERYNTQSKFLFMICTEFMGYKDDGNSYDDWGSKLLPFKLSKEERYKYKVALRLLE